MLLHGNARWEMDGSAASLGGAQKAGLCLGINCDTFLSVVACLCNVLVFAQRGAFFPSALPNPRLGPI